MTEPSSSSSYSLSSKKRPRSPNDNDEHSLLRDQICSSLEDNLTFNDTMIALQLMRTQFPKLEKVAVQPFILQSQLYSSVKDRTQVDRDLEVLLFSGTSVHCYVLWNETFLVSIFALVLDLSCHHAKVYH
jgi:hypothetical protein